MRRTPGLIMAAGLTLLAQQQPTFYAAWEDGRDAEAQGQWKAARAAYARALALRPQPAARVLIYGNNLLCDYYPQARMARCSLELGELEAAEAQLKASEAAREPAGLRLDILQRLQAARRASAPPPAVPSETPRPEAQHPAPAPAPVPPALPLPSVPVPTEGDRTPRLPARGAPDSVSISSVPLLPVPYPRSGPAQGPATPAPEVHPSTPPSAFPWRSFLVGGGLGLLGFWMLILRRKRPTHLEQHPDRIGAYEIERLLGRGGFASTYLGRHSRTGQRVALKVLHPYRQDDPEFVGRFRLEARLGALMDHPGIVRILELGPDTGTLWLAMEYVEGQRLGDWIKDRGPLPVEVLLELAIQLAEAMAHAHAHCVVHRDLKPSNILLVGNRVKVADFGIARKVDSDTLTGTYAFLGTPTYAAPEVQFHTRIGTEADLYSFGVLLFEMAAGRPPFEGATPFEVLDRHRREALPDLAALRSDLPEPFRDLVQRLCAKEPEHRPKDVEVLDVLHRLASSRM